MNSKCNQKKTLKFKVKKRNLKLFYNKFYSKFLVSSEAAYKEFKKKYALDFNNFSSN